MGHAGFGRVEVAAGAAQAEDALGAEQTAGRAMDLEGALAYAESCVTSGLGESNPSD